MIILKYFNTQNSPDKLFWLDCIIWINIRGNHGKHQTFNFPINMIGNNPEMVILDHCFVNLMRQSYTFASFPSFFVSLKKYMTHWHLKWHHTNSPFRIHINFALIANRGKNWTVFRFKLLIISDQFGKVVAFQSLVARGKRIWHYVC